jgi:hypothetical protein
MGRPGRARHVGRGRAAGRRPAAAEARRVAESSRPRARWLRAQPTVLGTDR